jgi:hypothetical protein
MKRHLGVWRKSRAHDGRRGEAIQLLTNLNKRLEDIVYDDEIARAILEYLREQPASGDTVEGISKWWIMRQRISESVEMVRLVLSELARQGLIFERPRADGNTIYFAKRSFER